MENEKKKKIIKIRAKINAIEKRKAIGKKSDEMFLKWNVFEKTKCWFFEKASNWKTTSKAKTGNKGREDTNYQNQEWDEGHL